MMIAGHDEADTAQSLREQLVVLRAEKRSIKVQLARLTEELASTQAQIKAGAAAAQAQEQALQELAHRTRNNLQLVVGLLELEARRIGHPAARERLREVAGRVHRLGTSHDGLHHLGAAGEVDLVAYLAGLGRTLAGMLERPRSTPAGRRRSACSSRRRSGMRSGTRSRAIAAARSRSRSSRATVA